jgi:hypothetical protein
MLCTPGTGHLICVEPDKGSTFVGSWLHNYPISAYLPGTLHALASIRALACASCVHALYAATEVAHCRGLSGCRL